MDRQKQQDDDHQRVPTRSVPSTTKPSHRPTNDSSDPDHQDRALSVLSALGFSASWDVVDVDSVNNKHDETEIVFGQHQEGDVENPSSKQRNSNEKRVSFLPQEEDNSTTPVANTTPSTMSMDSTGVGDDQQDESQSEILIGEFMDPEPSIHGFTTTKGTGGTRKRPALERRQSSAQALGQRRRRRLAMRRMFRRRQPEQQTAAWEPALAGGDSQQRDGRRLQASLRNGVPGDEEQQQLDDDDNGKMRKGSYATQSSSSSWWNKIFGCFSTGSNNNNSPKFEHKRSNHGDFFMPSESRQFNLTTDHGQGNSARKFLQQYLGISFEYDDANGTRHITCYGMSMDLLVTEYLHWCFRSSFAAVFLSLWVSFLVWTLLFALVLWYLGRENPTCIGGVDFETDYFADAWALSWTTFSTVGYGLIFSGISADEPDIKKCTAITIVVALESFVGVLFASFLGAIIFAKIGRTQSYAQIMFSDPVLIRFGEGVLGDHVDADHDVTIAATTTTTTTTNNKNDDKNPAEAGSDADKNEKGVSQHVDREAWQKAQHREKSMMQQQQQDSIAELAEHGLVPPPVLEFQLVNRLSGIKSGEIMDASVNIVASINADQACHTIKKATKRRRKKKSKKRAAKPVGGSGPGSRHDDDGPLISMESGDSDDGGTGEPDHWVIHDVAKFSTILKSFESDHEPSHVSFEEDPTGHLVPHQIFSRLEVETQDHPFFRRIWTVRHVLDANSPLLTTAARDLVTSCGGLWPKDISTAKYVRHAVNFDQLLVSFSGTSNADANTVYAQKVYEYDALNVGFRFVNMLYRDRFSGRVKVDFSLINDVREQAGGGAEDLHNPLGDLGSSESKLNHVRHSASMTNMMSI